MPEPKPSRWHVPPDAELHWRSWDEQEHLVYHAQSGDTHYLNPVAAEVLRYLQGSSATADELTRQLAGTIGVEADNALLDQIEQLLGQLDELGLIEPRCDDPDTPSGEVDSPADASPLNASDESS